MFLINILAMDIKILPISKHLVCLHGKYHPQSLLLQGFVKLEFQ